jgi:hypothetical protein
MRSRFEIAAPESASAPAKSFRMIRTSRPGVLAGRCLAFALAFALARAAGAVAAPAAAVPTVEGSQALVRAAEELVGKLAPERNVYGSHPTEVDWGDSATGRPASNRSVCSSFLSRLLGHAYEVTPEQLAAWTGHREPHARDYYAAVAAGRGFTRIETVDAIRPGDVVAIAYPPGSGSTGHVMLVDGFPEARDATPPLRAGTRQFALAVIDSSHSVHGPADTRGMPKRHGTGVGRGTFRLYADPSGNIVAYAWSLLPGSRLQDVRVRTLAIGRFDPGSRLGGTPPPASGGPGSDDAPSAER